MSLQNESDALRYFIELSYNGKSYHGWQIQPNDISVQEVVEKGLTTILGCKITTMGAGRTDTGVHAIQMFAHFDTDLIFEETKLVFKLNSFLPVDIAIHSIFKVKPEVHARFEALSRTYVYKVNIKKNAFTADTSYYVRKVLDVNKMNEGAEVLFQYKDFQCFSKSNTDVKTYNCEIMKAHWFYKDDELHFEIQANRFLRNMVRAIVGTMINIGMGKIEVADLHSIIKSKNRSEAGFSVPAHALYLTKIEYPEDIKL